MNRDPIGYEGSQWNLYEYVESAPTLFDDAFGLDHRDNCQRIIRRTEDTIDKLIQAVTDGKNDGLKECMKRAKQWANAGGYESDELQEEPECFKRAVRDMEGNWALSAVSLCFWAGYTGTGLVGLVPPGEDSGTGDAWLKHEIWRLEMLRKRLKVLCELPCPCDDKSPYSGNGGYDGSGGVLTGPTGWPISY